METKLPTCDNFFLENLIPQKKPFVMVDELISFSQQDLTSGFVIKEDNLFLFEGYFQASGILEHQAQSVALHTGYQYFLLKKNAPTGYIGAVKTFEVEYLPKIGEKLTTEVSILNEIMGVTLVDIITKIDDKIVAKSQLKTVLKK